LTNLYDFEQKPTDNCDDLRACNHTELYQLCRRAGLRVSPNMPKGTLLALLDGELEDTAFENPIDDLRDGLMEYLLQHWRKVSSQLFCPAKDGDPKSCYRCSDAQIIHCLTTNDPQVERGVTDIIRRKKQR
jgi:hypothetical protein